MELSPLVSHMLTCVLHNHNQYLLTFQVTDPFPSTASRSTGSGSPTTIVSNTAVKDSDWIFISVGVEGSMIDDVESYLFWVNGTRLSPLSTSQGSVMMTAAPIISPFPFTRLAATSPLGSTAFYLYHQISAGVFAEDVWDKAIGSWSSSNVSISAAGLG